jgi:hypothetical protein
VNAAALPRSSGEHLGDRLLEAFVRIRDHEPRTAHATLRETS